MSSTQCAGWVCAAFIAMLSGPAPCQGGKLVPVMSLRQASPQFSGPQIVGRVTAAEIVEASGLGASRRHPGVLYTLNDSGNSAVVYALDSRNGNLLARLTIRDAVNIDWEDIAVGPCDADSENGYCIYIGDIGRNASPNPADRLYRVREPAVMGDATLDIDATLEYIWAVPDCESLMVDPQGEVYLISKITGGSGSVTRVPRTAWGLGSRVTLTTQSQIQVHTDNRGPVAADISPNGQEILVKTYNHAYYWRLASGESYSHALTRTPIEVPHATEPQGESICWSSTANGYYSLSERTNQPLYFFRRL